jgi:hypothetical protein
LIFGSQNPGESVVQDASLLSYVDPKDPPISLVLTEFHYLLLYSTKIQAISVLNKEVVWEESFRTVRGERERERESRER